MVRTWVGRIAAFVLAMLAVMMGLGLLAIGIRPPELLRVGSAYAAKIVCSNVALAGRDPEEVMAVDVQAPGNPLLRLIDVEVASDGTTDVSFPLGIASQRAVPRDGLGCALVGPSGSPAALAPVPAMPAVAASALPVRPNAEIEALLGRDELLGPGFRAVLVLHRGEVVAERYAPDFDPGTPLLGWSMAKTVTAALVGTAVEQGIVDLGERALLPEWTDERAAIGLADLLAMQSGLSWNEGYGTVSDVTRMLFLRRDAGAFAAERPLQSAPGMVFKYSTGTTVLLARILRQRLDANAARYPYDALFGPLGMAETVFELDASGTHGAGSLIYATARDWARFARFLLAKGRAPDGRLIVPEGYVEWMMEPTKASGGRYGRGQVWRRGPTDHGTTRDAAADAGLPADTAWMLGHDGQSTALVPSRDLAIVRLGLTPQRLGYRPQNLLREVLLALEPRDEPTT